MTQLPGGSDPLTGDYVLSTFGERDWRSLRDIVQTSEIADELVARGETLYDIDRVLQLAGEALVLRIGEAASRLSPELVAACPEIRLRAMRAMRNVVAHHYEAVDPGIVWQTLSVEMPKDVTKIRDLLAR